MIKDCKFQALAISVSVVSLLVFFYFETSILRDGPLWQSYTLPWAKIWPFVIGFSCYLGSLFLLQKKVSRLDHCIVFCAATIVSVLALHSSLLLSGQWLIFLLAAWLFAEAGCWILDKLPLNYSPLWLGLLVS